MNIALIGYRGTGKTTIGTLLSKKLDKKLVSTDSEFAKKTKLSIDKYIKKHGWERFRELESQIVEKVSEFDDCIIDAGGGIVERNENVVNLKRNSLVVLLTSDVKTITARLKSDKPRPALTKGNYLTEVEKVLLLREPRYRKAADFAIDTSRLSPAETCELIIHYYQSEIELIK